MGGGVVGRQWAWLLDIERGCGLVIGRCLEGMLFGLPVTTNEKFFSKWLDDSLFSEGLSDTKVDLSLLQYALDFLSTESASGIQVLRGQLQDFTTSYPLICSVLEDILNADSSFVPWMEDIAWSEDWDTVDVNKEPLLETVSHVALAALLTHTKVTRSLLE